MMVLYAVLCWHGLGRLRLYRIRLTVNLAEGDLA